MSDSDRNLSQREVTPENDDSDSYPLHSASDEDSTGSGSGFTTLSQCYDDPPAQLLQQAQGALEPIQCSSLTIVPSPGLEVANSPTDEQGAQVVHYNISQNINLQQFGDVTVEATRNLNIGGTQNITNKKTPRKEEEKTPLTMAQKIRRRTASGITAWTKGMVKTQGLRNILDKVKKGAPWITVKGPPGEGKTTAAYMALEELQNEGREVFHVITPEEFTEVTMAYQSPVIMMDDVLGDLDFDEFEWRRWKSALHHVVDLKLHRGHEEAESAPMKKNATIILVGRDYIFNSASHHIGKMSEFVTLEKHAISISHSSDSDIQEKIDIWNAIAEASGIKLAPSLINNICQMTTQHGFPHVCRLFATIYKQGNKVNALHFFEAPIEFLNQTIETLMSDKKKLNLFKKMIEGGGKISDRGLGKGMSELREAVYDLLGTYMKQEEDYFMFDHPSVYDSVAYHLCKLDPLFVIENCKLSFIHQRLQLQLRSLYGTQPESQVSESLVVDISECYAEDLAKRFAAELTNSNLLYVLSHSACTQEMFVRQMMSQISLPLEDVVALTDRESYDQESFLFLIASNKSFQVLKFVNEAMKLTSRQSQTVLFGICKFAASDALSYLTRNCEGYDIDAIDANCMSPIMISAATKDDQFVHQVMALHPDMSFQNPRLLGKRKALHIFSMHGLVSVIEVLLDIGRDINVKDLCGRSPLYYAICNNHLEAVKLLLDRGANFDAEDIFASCLAADVSVVKLIFQIAEKYKKPLCLDTPFHCSTSYGDPYCLCSFTDKGEPVDWQAGSSYTFINTACSRGNFDLFNFLIEKGARVNSRDEKGFPLVTSACIGGNMEILRFLLTSDVSVNSTDSSGWSPLHEACQRNRYAAVRCLLDSGATVHVSDSQSKSPLHISADKGHHECITQLLRAGSGMEVNKRDISGNTPLHTAAGNGHTRCVQILLQAGAGTEINKRDARGNTPLHTAAGNRHRKCVQLLIQAGADVNMTGQSGFTALINASEKGCFDELLQAGASVHERNENGDTLLHEAVVVPWETEKCLLLLQAGLSVNVQNKQGCTPLHKAVEKYSMKCLHVLLKAGADVNTKNTHDHTALHTAIKMRYGELVDMLILAGAAVPRDNDEELLNIHTAITTRSVQYVKTLLKAGVHANDKNKDGFPPIYEAAGWKSADCVNALLEAGVDVNRTFKDGSTPLHRAARYGSANCVDSLLKAGGDCNLRDVNGSTPLLLAACLPSIKCITLLLEAGASVNEHDSGRNSPLHAAVTNHTVDNADFIKTILKAGANVNAKNSSGDTPLHVATRLENYCIQNSKVIEILLHAGAGVNIQNYHGDTALHETAHGDSVAMLLEAGATVNAQNKDNRTPLHKAAETGSLLQDVLPMLLKAGADVNARQNDGATPLHLALSKGRDECYDVLLKYGADVNITDNSGRTPLHIATSNAKLVNSYFYTTFLPICQTLVRLGVDVNKQDQDGNTPLHLLFHTDSRMLQRISKAEFTSVIETELIPLANLLVVNGADVNVKNNKGKNSLR